MAIVEQANIPLETLDFPKTVNVPDGRFFTHCTVHITLVISGNQREQIQLFVIPSPYSPVVLGHPWLKFHNHTYDSTTSSISSWSVFCHSHCLHSAVPAHKTLISTPPVHLDSSQIPQVYHGLTRGFSKEPAQRPADSCSQFSVGNPANFCSRFSVGDPANFSSWFSIDNPVDTSQWFQLPWLTVSLCRRSS